MKIGIDLGGTKIEIVALDDSILGNKEVYRKRVSTPQGNYHQTLETITGLINESEHHLNQKASIGIGIPGAISALTGLVKNANSTCLIGKPLQKDLELRLNRKIKLSNDANCMTISEAVDGAAKDYNVVFGVIIGTGTGGGISFNKQILNGANLIAGEWGHNPMPWQNTDKELPIKCYCGQTNCIETFLSGPGLILRYQALGGEADDVQNLLLQADNNQPLAIQAIKNYEIYLAKALSSIINILDPDCIVLAGGLSNIKSLYKNVPELWSDTVFSDQVNTRLVRAAHGDSSGVRGAAWL